MVLVEAHGLSIMHACRIAALSATVDPALRTLASAPAASGIALVDVRSSHPKARYGVVSLPGMVATYPAWCGCGASWTLAVCGAGLCLELGEEVEWDADGLGVG